MLKKLPEGYRVELVWNALNEAQIQQLAAFLNANALKDPARALARAHQVAALAYDPDGNIVAELSARPRLIKQLLNRFWDIAAYTHPEHRSHNLAGHLIVAARDFFEARFKTGHDVDIIGTSITMQTPIYKQVRTAAVTENSGAMFIGRNQRGDDVRVYYFENALIDQGAAGVQPTPSQGPVAQARIEVCWEQRHTPELQEKVAAFLQREGALKDPARAAERAGHTAAIAYDKEGNIVAELSAQARVVEQLDNKLWHIATYVAPSHRGASLPADMTIAVRDYLEGRFLAGQDDDVIGIFAIIRSRAWQYRRNFAVSEKARLAFIGRNKAGDNVRVFYFKGAHIDLSHKL